MTDPITIAVLAKLWALATHASAAHAAAATASGHAAVGHAAVGHVAVGHAAGHSSAASLVHAGSVVWAVPVPATVGGATFLAIYNEMVKDAYQALKRHAQGRPHLTPAERRYLLSEALAETRRRLYLTERDTIEINKLHRQLVVA